MESVKHVEGDINRFTERRKGERLKCKKYMGLRLIVR